MSHSFSNIWIHTICGTKYREPLIMPDYEARIHTHIENELEKIQCPSKIINGTEDHIHVLYRQNPKIAIIDVLKQIKGNTSNWINSENFFNYKFAWQTGYGAFSVSESQLEKVVTYI